MIAIFFKEPKTMLLIFIATEYMHGSSAVNKKCMSDEEDDPWILGKVLLQSNPHEGRQKAQRQCEGYGNSTRI